MSWRELCSGSHARAVVQHHAPVSIVGGGIERDDPFGGAYGASLGVRAADFVFVTVAGSDRLVDGEPLFPESFERQLEVVGEHVVRRLRHFDCTIEEIVDAVVWVHPSVDIAPSQLLEDLQTHVFRGVMPALSFIRSPMLYPEALVGVKVVAFAPLG